MKFLYVNSDKIILQDIAWGLLELGEKVDIYTEEITLQTFVEEEKEKLSKYLRENQYDAVITYNFSITISESCKERDVKYIAWIFDAPQFELYEKAAKNQCNYLFVFDRVYAERLKKQGLPNVFYQPLAANITKTALMEIREEDVERFSADISFVGSLYQDNYYDKYRAEMPEEIARELDSIIEEHGMRWQIGATPMGILSEEFHEKFTLFKKFNLETGEGHSHLVETAFLAQKIARKERIQILEELAKEFSVDLYTRDRAAFTENVKVHPEGAKQGEETPKIYHLSKINLNITLRSIETGIPLRVFGIMAAGGFVLSNYQEEMEELFVPEKEIVLFHHMDELKEKAAYYLSHERERLQIAYEGFLKAKSCYSYPVVLKKMIETVKQI